MATRSPTLILQGDDDQLVPFAASGQHQSKLVKGATLKIYKGAPHGLWTTHKDQVNADLLAFLPDSGTIGFYSSIRIVVPP